jgi:y4mF family transcriptional regulator
MLESDQFLHRVREGLTQGISPKPYPIAAAADLAPLIRKARKRMKMSQQQFADACGVGRRFLSELENGKPSLEFDKVLKCALGAGIDLLAKPRIPL